MIQAAAAVPSGGASSTQSLSSTEDFMTLLVAQLRVQDPLSPMDPSEFMSQLAQLQSVAELQKIGQLLSDTTLGDAVNLIGRTVQWIDPTTGDTRDATVDRVEIAGGRCVLIAGDARLAPGEILTISS